MQLSNQLAIAMAVESKLPEVIVERTAQVEAYLAAVGKLWTSYMATKPTVEGEGFARALAENRTRMVQEGCYRPLPRCAATISSAPASCAAALP